MRPKVVLVILLAGAAGLAGLLFLKKMLTARPPTVPVPIAQSAVPAPANVAPALQISPLTNISPATSRAAPAAPVVIAPRIAAAPDADYVQKKIDRLQELQANDDEASLNEILAELTNTNPVIRHEAVEATIQFGGHTAVPVLRDLAARTSDPDEKKELLDAADFLELPTLTEIRAQNPNVKIAPPQPAPVQP